MNDRLSYSALMWGAVLTLAGAALTAVGLGWWDLAAINLALVGPVFVVLAGTAILLEALSRDGGRRGEDHTPQ